MTINEKIKNILSEHELLTLGTLDETGFPDVRSVDFVVDNDDESKIYFTTFKGTKKVKEIELNNQVYVVVDKAANSIEELAQIKYLRAKGKAYVVNEPGEAQKAMGLLMQKYPFLSELLGDPSMMSIYRIELREVAVTDNSLGFGHVDHHNY